MNDLTAQKQSKSNLPAQLKSNIEAMSGFSMDDVRVHYNSSKPAQMKALAYTQGTDIHVGPGQEKHLGHEAWHVVQQKQGRVAPTAQLKGVNVNTDSSLEHEADVMGARASVFSAPASPVVQRKPADGAQGATVQFGGKGKGKQRHDQIIDQKRVAGEKEERKEQARIRKKARKQAEAKARRLAKEKKQENAAAKAARLAEAEARKLPQPRKGSVPLKKINISGEKLYRDEVPEILEYSFAKGTDRKGRPLKNDRGETLINWSGLTNDGFLDGTRQNFTLKKGKRIARYGNEYGTFVTDIGTPYQKLSLPYFEDSQEYHEYSVNKPFTCDKGLAAPGFKNPGGGVQYKLFTSIGKLVDSGTLRRTR